VWTGEVLGARELLAAKWTPRISLLRDEEEGRPVRSKATGRWDMCVAG